MCFFLIAINTRSARIEETSIYPYSVTLLESPVFGHFGLLGIFTLYISEFTTLGMNVVFCMFN